MADETDVPLLEPSTAEGHVVVFDSGMGGLTVAAELAALGPRLAIDYAADTGFFPYGDKSDEALQARLPDVARAIVGSVHPDVFVIACNTASTLALDAVREVLDIPVVGTVPAIKPAVSATRTRTIGLLATPGTISRDYTAELIRDYAKGARVIQHGSVELVRLAEAHAAGDMPPLSAFEEAQRPLFEQAGGWGIDTVVLACTHFPLVREALAATSPRPVRYIDSGAAIARQTIRVLPAVSRNPEAEGGRAYVTRPRSEDARLASVLKRFGYMTVDEISVPSALPAASEA